MSALAYFWTFDIWGVDRHGAVDILMMPQLEYVTSPTCVGLGYVGRIQAWAALGSVGRPREAAGDAMGGNALRYREKLIPIPQCQPIKANRSFVPKKTLTF